MGTGASSNPTRFTLATGLAASRWKSRANSTKSESSISSANLRQENDATSQVGVDDKLISPNDVKVEGRYENPFQKKTKQTKIAFIYPRLCYNVEMVVTYTVEIVNLNLLWRLKIIMN